QQRTATCPSSTATAKTKLAEGAAFEPAAQGLPVHGISSAAPSAARSPLRMQSLTPMPSERKIWRRGEDLNPRGTFWAPIRFRVGRLQPGSATPPRQYRRQFIPYLTLRAECLQLRSLSLVEIPQRSRCSGRPWRAPVGFSRRLLPSVPWRQVRVPLNHAQWWPAAQRLDRSQVYRSSDETRSDRVARGARHVQASI